MSLVRDAFMRKAVQSLLVGIGEDPAREGLRDTPDRVARSLLELTAGYRERPAAILRARFRARYDEMVVLRGVEFWSLCEHHLLPFHGTATVGYLPNGGVVGISKLARLVHCFSRRLQLQERMTAEIALAIQRHLKPRGAGVLVQATHLCMACRGVRTPGTMVTSYLTGAFRRASTRAEFLSLGRP